VVNGLGLAQGDGPLGPFGILPLGSANDLAYALKIPTDLQGAARIISAGHVRLMDVGRVDGRLFANNSAIGLEPFVTTLQVKITRVKGMLRYLVAALQGIWARPAWKARLEWDDGSYEGPLTLMSIGIGSRSGGVFYMIPHADPFDAKFTFAFGYRSGRREMLALLPRAMKPDKGSYVEAEGMWEINTTRLKVHLDTPSPAHTDGKLFSELVSELDYELLPARLRILTPA
jgi:diacylglycerol kinase (ATP)